MVGDSNPLFHRQGDWGVEDEYRIAVLKMWSQVHSISIIWELQRPARSWAHPTPNQNQQLGGWDDPVLQVVLITSLRLRVTDVVIEPTDSQGRER